MFKFILGLFIGAIFGFIVCAIFSASHTDDGIEPEFQKAKEENDAEIK